MVIKTGQLRSVVQFKVNLPVVLGAGYEDQYFDYGQTRGFLKSKSGGRNLITGEIESNNHYELYIRYQPYYAKVDLRIVIDGRNFTIDTVENIEEGKKSFLKYSLTEKK
jgi:hypothetical protein